MFMIFSENRKITKALFLLCVPNVLAHNVIKVIAEEM